MLIRYAKAACVAIFIIGAISYARAESAFYVGLSVSDVNFRILSPLLEAVLLRPGNGASIGPIVGGVSEIWLFHHLCRIAIACTVVSAVGSALITLVVERRRNFEPWAAAIITFAPFVVFLTWRLLDRTQLLRGAI